MDNKKKKEITGLGITSLVFGIVGLIAFPIFMGIVALIFGIICAKRDSLGVAGIILGIIDILIGIIIIGLIY